MPSLSAGDVGKGEGNSRAENLGEVAISGKRRRLA